MGRNDMPQTCKPIRGSPRVVCSPHGAPEPSLAPTLNGALTTIEAAAVLGVSPGTLENWRVQHSSGPPFVKIGSRAVRYLRADLDAFLRDATRRNTGGADR